MYPDMPLQELAAVLPKMMPQCEVSKGQHILVRFMRRNSIIHRAKILDIFDPVSGERYPSVVLEDTSSGVCLKVSVQGDEATERPLWPFQDQIFTYSWVNGWAGMEVAKPPKGEGGNVRLRKLLDK